MSLYDAAEWLILAFWTYTLWWAFTKYEPTPLADEVERWLAQLTFERRFRR